MTWKPMSEPHGAVSNGAPSASNEAKREADQKRKGGVGVSNRRPVERISGVG
jgi:hypothetical protein